jgi:hypothetical protein
MQSWEDNIKLDIKEIAQGVWIAVIWPRIGTGGDLVNTEVNFMVP